MTLPDLEIENGDWGDYKVATLDSVRALLQEVESKLTKALEGEDWCEVEYLIEELRGVQK